MYDVWRKGSERADGVEGCKEEDRLWPRRQRKLADGAPSLAGNWRETMTEGNLSRLQYQFSYLNKLPIDSTHGSEGGHVRSGSNWTSKRLVALSFSLHGVWCIRAARVCQMSSHPGLDRTNWRQNSQKVCIFCVLCVRSDLRRVRSGRKGNELWVDVRQLSVVRGHCHCYVCAKLG